MKKINKLVVLGLGILVANFALAGTVVCPSQSLNITCQSGHNCTFDLTGTADYQGWKLNPSDMVDIPAAHDVLNLQVLTA